MLGRSIQPPRDVQACLRTVFGDDVDRVRIIEYSFFARLHSRMVATTRRRRIYLRGSAAEFFDNPTLMLHEYCHVLKQWEPRELTATRYVLEWLRRGYWENRFEVEARNFTDRHIAHYRVLLAEQRKAAPSPEQGFPVV